MGGCDEAQQTREPPAVHCAFVAPLSRLCPPLSRLCRALSRLVRLRLAVAGVKGASWSKEVPCGTNTFDVFAPSGYRGTWACAHRPVAGATTMTTATPAPVLTALDDASNDGGAIGFARPVDERQYTERVGAGTFLDSVNSPTRTPRGAYVRADAQTKST